jgi:hypothetical protein
MDGEEFGHVGIYSIIDEFIYPVPVGTHTKQWMIAPPPDAPTTHCDTVETHSLAPMSTIVQPRCGVKVRARLFFEGDDDDDATDGYGTRTTERKRLYSFIYGWRAIARRARRAEAGWNAERARGRRKGVARDMHLSVRDSIPCSATGVPTTGE